MCTVADALISKGIQKGKIEGKIELLSEMDYSIPDIADRLNISEEQVRKVLQK